MVLDGVQFGPFVKVWHLLQCAIVLTVCMSGESDGGTRYMPLLGICTLLTCYVRTCKQVRMRCKEFNFILSRLNPMLRILTFEGALT